MRAINKYTDHKARCIIAYDDSFAFDHDILLKSKNGERDAEEWVKQCDFFHFGRGIFNWKGVDFNNLLNKFNCCIEYYGSELRSNYEKIAAFHEKTGISAITGTDWTITGRLPNSFYHLGQYFTRYGDLDELDVDMAERWLGSEEGVQFKIATASAGSPLKGYDYLNQVVAELKAEGHPVEVVSISGVSNYEVLKRKAKCHATFTSLHGGWGMSGVESMFLGHPVLCSLDPWTMSLYPESPTVIINRANLKETIENLVIDWEEADDIGIRSRRFAINNFNTRTILKRYLYLWDLIQNKEACLVGGHNPTIIYDQF
jgi:glycosyltransferase involved in cell wall biosynthesis